MRTRWGPNKKDKPHLKRNSYYVCGNAFSKRGCTHGKLYPAAPLEAEVRRLVDSVLSDPDKITRDVDEAIERERGVWHDPDAAAALWAERIAECDRRRAKNQELFRADAITLEEVKADNARIEEDRAVAQNELAKVQDAGQRVEELEERRRAILSWFGTGLQLGMAYLPPSLRHATYGLLGLQATVEPGGRVSVGGILDASVVHLNQDVEEYVDALESVGAEDYDEPMIAARYEEIRHRIEVGEYGEAYITEAEALEILSGWDTPGRSPYSPG